MKNLILVVLIASAGVSVTALANEFNAPVPTGTRAELSGDATITGTATIGDTGDCTRVDINVTGDFTGTNDLGGGTDQIRVSVWDDQEEKDFQIVDIPVGDTVTIDVDLGFEGVIGQGAPGVGVYVFDGPDDDFGNTLVEDDPFNPQEVPGTCGDGPIVSIPVNSPWALVALVLLLLIVGSRFSSFRQPRG